MANAYIQNDTTNQQLRLYLPDGTFKVLNDMATNADITTALVSTKTTDNLTTGTLPVTRGGTGVGTLPSAGLVTTPGGTGALSSIGGTGIVQLSNGAPSVGTINQVRNGTNKLTVLDNGSVNVDVVINAPSAAFEIYDPNLTGDAVVSFRKHGDAILSVKGNSGGTTQLFSIRNDGSNAVYLNTQNSIPLCFGVSTGDFPGTTTSMLNITSAGRVGIGTTSPSYRFQVGETSSYGYVADNGSWQVGSDVRFKENIVPIANALDLVLRIQGIRYTFIGDDAIQVGFSAQAIEEVLPEVVSTDDNGYKGVSYAQLTPVLVNAIKEQQLIIESQQAQIDELRKTVEMLVNNTSHSPTGEPAPL